MAEFAMLSSMTGSPRYLFSIQGVSKSQTAGYIFCKLSNVVVRCAPIVNECLCISQNYLFATRFVRWVREGLSALQVWTLVWGLPGPGRASCLRAWGAKFPGRNFGPILASGIFFMFYQLDFDSHVIQTILLSTEWGGASAWFAVDRNTQHQELHDSFHRWSFCIDLTFHQRFQEKKNTDSQQWRRIAALVCNGSGQSWCKIFHFWTRQPMSHMDHKEIVFIFPPSGKPPSTKKWLYLAIFAPISLL